MYKMGSTYSVSGTQERIVGVVIPSSNTSFHDLCSLATRDTKQTHTHICAVGCSLQADALTVPIKGHFRIPLDC